MEAGESPPQARDARPRRRRRRPRPLPRRSACDARLHHATPATGSASATPSRPTSSPRATRRSSAGDVVAIEPGLYIEGVGGMRFERNYLITADGFETLSNHEIRIEP